VPSQHTEPPPLPLDDEAFEEVPLLMREIEAAIAKASGNELKVLRLMAEHLKSIDRKTVQSYDESRNERRAIAHAIGCRFDRLEKRFDQVDAGVKKVEDEAVISNHLALQGLHFTKQIPRVLETAEVCVVLADGALQAAKNGSRLTQTTLAMMQDLRRQEVAANDVVSEEPARDNVIPFRPAPERPTFEMPRKTRMDASRRSAAGAVALLVMTFATAALSMSGGPYVPAAKAPMDCRLVQGDVYDCQGKLWLATKKTPLGNGKVDLDLKPYRKR